MKNFHQCILITIARSEFAELSASDILVVLPNIYRGGNAVRLHTPVLLLSFIAASISFAEDAQLACNGKPLTSCIGEMHIDQNSGPRLFTEKHRFDTSLNVSSFRGRPWFKPVVIVYWIGAAVDSYRDNDELKLKSPAGREPTLSAPFETDEGLRVIFIPRSTPVLLFRRGMKKPREHLWAIHVTSGGAAVTCAFTLESERPPRR